MDIFQSAFLGIVQGLGEFLPISSTAHLALVPYFFNFKDPGLAFDAALHIGTLVAVLAYFWKDWLMIFRQIFNASNPETEAAVYSKKTLWLLAAATVPGVLAGYFLEKEAETVFRGPLVIAAALAGGGLLLYLTDKYFQHTKKINTMTFSDALIIGLAQAVAIIPGISRSGATITAGLWRGLDRAGAARFSFLLSTPIIFGAAAVEAPKLLAAGVSGNILIGIFFSAISGYLAIKYLLKLVETMSYRGFFWYRLALAIFIVALTIIRR